MASDIRALRAWIKVQHVSVTIKRKELLKDVNVSFIAPKIYGIVGPNGIGKSVFLKTLLGFIRPTNGVVQMNNIVIDPRRSLPIKVGTIIEHPGFINDLSGHNNLKMLGNIQSSMDDEQVSEAIQRVGLIDDSKPVADYSLGMVQRLGIAQAIMEDQPLIILDEPTNALDGDGVDLLTGILKELRMQGKLVIIASHEKSWLVSIADEIYRINQGRLVLVEDVSVL